MQTITTRSGKQIELVSVYDLLEPRGAGNYIRAFCHIHGSDHQRSLSIHRASGWGRCFNAACQATVLVMEWNPDIAARLIQSTDEPSVSGQVEIFIPARTTHTPAAQEGIPTAHQLNLQYPPETPQWQQDELLLLHTLKQSARYALKHDRHVHAYLRERGISPRLASVTGLGYLALPVLKSQERLQQQFLGRWVYRLVFPLTSPMGSGYIGRTLWGWRPGMDETHHKALLERADRQRRWIKTNPAGWYSSRPGRIGKQIIMVEGGFDRLTLLQAGFRAEEVVALVGTTAPAHWLPPQVQSIILALDGDAGGHEASLKLATQFTDAGISVHLCLPPDDHQGKDWNERWRRQGYAGIKPVIEMYRSLYPERSWRSTVLKRRHANRPQVEQAETDQQTTGHQLPGE